MTQRVLDVGQCDIDNWQIKQLLQKNFNVEVDRAKSHSDALSAIQRQSYDLVLLNRINDSDGSSGLDFLRQLKAGAPTSALPVMLVSNYPDSQSEAVDAGAFPGFGKASLNAPETVDRLRQALDNKSTESNPKNA